MPNKRLNPEDLYTVCDLSLFSFRTTDELADLDRIVGQNRALESLRFGVGIQHEGFNIYALGLSGSGKHSAVNKILKAKASEEATPPDWCYINNFLDPHKPKTLVLPSGSGIVFQKNMAQLVDDLRSVVPEALESDEYRVRRQEIEEAYDQRQASVFEDLKKEADKHDIVMMRTPTGFAFAPRKNGEVIKPEEYSQLSDKEQEKIEVHVTTLQESLERLIHQVPKWRREMQQEIKKLNRDVVMSAVGGLIDELRRNYSELPDVIEYLNNMQQDVIEHANQFRRTDDGESVLPALSFLIQDKDRHQNIGNRYQVNVLVNHSHQQGAPVVFLDNPTYPNLVGRVEHQAELGALVTDFTMIKPGALHQANGGYLIVDVRKILTQPYAWEGLKRVLRSNEIKIESLGQMLSLISTVSLEPESIPLKVKVVLVGERLIYYLLSEYDDEFAELFKVAADFNDTMDRSTGNDQLYAQYFATIARQENLRPISADGVARLIEHSARTVSDSRKLSTRFVKIADFLREADYWAGDAGHKVVTAIDIQNAIDARLNRYSRIQERLQEETLRDTLMIATEGEMIGQVNGLSIMSIGEHAFGHPSRITARVRLGKGEVLDIEREIKLGGPIHSKGVLILNGFLSGRYCPDQPLTLKASLVFEQTYGGVEGDSASSAELYALLSALAQTPIKQSLAVTGSVNQHGHIQAIGGVNQKIEGFFDICASRGLNGEQGVLIPKSNVKHLMLRKDVVAAVSNDKFHVYAIETVDEGISILTGCDAGERNMEGKYPKGSINGRVESRLESMASKARSLIAKSEDAD